MLSERVPHSTPATQVRWWCGVVGAGLLYGVIAAKRVVCLFRHTRRHGEMSSLVKIGCGDRTRLHLHCISTNSETSYTSRMIRLILRSMVRYQTGSLGGVSNFVY